MIKCKICKKESTKLIFDFGKIPAVNNFIFKKEIPKEKIYKLKLFICEKCWLLQLSDIPKPEILFNHYHHISSASKGNIDHLNKVSLFLKHNFSNKNKVLEIGCNDGTLLKFLKNLGFDCYGVDPAKNINQNSSIKIYKDFYNLNFIKKFKLHEINFDLVIGLNVFAHNDSFMEMFEASAKLLNEDGILISEVAYLPPTIGLGNFDTIYHEHVCTYSLLSLENALKLVGLHVFDAELLNTQGGSIRILASKNSYQEKTFNYLKIKKNEAKLGMNKIKYYLNIRALIRKKINDINHFFKYFIDRNQKLLLIGAPARGVVTMNVCENNNLKNHSIIVDDTIEKQGKLMPGVHIPIISWKECDFEKYDVCLILSWNYIDYLKERLQKTKFDGKIYVPFPILKQLN